MTSILFPLWAIISCVITGFGLMDTFIAGGFPSSRDWLVPFWRGLVWPLYILRWLWRCVIDYQP